MGYAADQEIRDRARSNGPDKENNMLVEVLNKLLGLAEPTRWTEDDGRVYSNRRMEEVQPPLIQPIQVQTLTGLTDLYSLEETPDKDQECAALIVHVVSHELVQIISRTPDEWRRRTVFVRAQVPTDSPRFRFGTFLEPDDFVIGLQTLFEDGGSKGNDHAKLLRLVSNLAAEQVTIASDDGYSQTVATRQGIALKGEEKISPRVELAPFRTFREVAQPRSEFVVRVRGRQNSTPMVALFEADGGEWKNTAIASIQKWLTGKLSKADIVA